MQIIENERSLKQIKDTELELPFHATQIDKAASLKVFAERAIHEPVIMKNMGCLVVNLPELSEVLRIWNNYKKELDAFFNKKIVIADPCPEITYYAWKGNREEYLKENVHPKMNEILEQATAKNYASVWLDAFENKADIVKFVESTVNKQSPLIATFPIVPILEADSPNALIDLAFEINEESCSTSQNLEKKYLGCYVAIHGSLLTNDARARKKFGQVATKLIELLKKYDDVYIYIKFLDIENIKAISIEKAINALNFVESLVALRGTDHINNHSFLLQCAGITKKFTAFIGKGADSVVELMNGKASVYKPDGFNTKNRKENFMFGDFYDMINQTMVSYDTLLDYYKKHKALPSYTEIAKGATVIDLENPVRYAKLKRINQIEARCIEIGQYKDDMIAGANRGLHDRLSRSVDEELKELAKVRI